MFGEPGDEDGECNARLFIGDNYGDGTATMRCQLAPGHDGVHREEFEREGGMVTITWVRDERQKCDHGCGKWEHEHGGSERSSCPKYAYEHEYSDCTYCHPGEDPKTCEKCGKTCYWLEGHKRSCPNETCESCGELGHTTRWCPKAIAEFHGVDDFAIAPEDPGTIVGAEPGKEMP